jgi:hypothetical protein
VERRLISLPSNGNVHDRFSPLELSLRKLQAQHHLNRLRDLIADKSFQYSHVIRAAPRKVVKTRARAKIKSLDNEIILHSRIYSRCRNRLPTLGADDRLLQIFQILTRDDVKASTAVLDPNTPGSTRVRLSWIWQTGTAARAGAGAEPCAVAESGAGFNSDNDATLLECMSSILPVIFD